MIVIELDHSVVVLESTTTWKRFVVLEISIRQKLMELVRT